MGQKVNPISNRLGIIRGWILIGTVAMIMVMLCWKTAKSVNI